MSVSSQMLDEVANKQIFPQTSVPLSTGCEHPPKKPSSSFSKPHPSEKPSICSPSPRQTRPACTCLGSKHRLGSCLGPRDLPCVSPQRDGTGSRDSRWDIGTPGGKVGEEEETECGRRKSVHRQAVLGIYAGKSQSSACEGLRRGRTQQRNHSLIPK